MGMDEMTFFAPAGRTENHLNGKVSFVSNVKDGTVFSVTI